tara:strand:- start:159 stop:428 length:270 start_codon:yes stop_codon:yes gene_type:complete
MARERINLNAGNYRFFCLNSLGLIALNDKLAILRLEDTVGLVIKLTAYYLAGYDVGAQTYVLVLLVVIKPVSQLSRHSGHRILVKPYDN